MKMAVCQDRDAIHGCLLGQAVGVGITVAESAVFRDRDRASLTPSVAAILFFLEIS